MQAFKHYEFREIAIKYAAEHVTNNALTIRYQGDHPALGDVYRIQTDGASFDMMYSFNMLEWLQVAAALKVQLNIA